MTDPDRSADEPGRGLALWLVIGFMILIALGGLVYGFTYPSIHAANPPQTVGSSPAHAPPRSM